MKVAARKPRLVLALAIILLAGLTTASLPPDTAWAAFGDRDSSKDFNTLAAGNTSPQGIWSDDTTMWVADSKLNDKLYAYTVSTKAKNSSKDIEIGNVNVSAKGIHSDGTTIWVAFNYNSASWLHAYTLSTKARDSNKDFYRGQNTFSWGIWSDGTTMWVADAGDDKLYAYTVSTKARDSSKDFNTLLAAGNNDPRGIYSDGTTMWVADSGDDKLYAYTVSTKARDSSKDFNTLSAAGNNDPMGIYSDGTTMWVADSGDDKLYAYSLATPLSAPTPTTSNVTASTANISWTTLTGAASYDVRHKKRTDSNWTTETTVTSPHSLASLSPDTGYETQLRAIASTGYTDSPWSASVDFTTLKNGLSAPSPNAGSVTTSGASVTWTAISNATSYDGRYKKQSDSNWTTSTGITSAWAISGLDANTAYEAQVRSQASGYADGAWSSSVNFTTLKIGLSAPAPSVGGITASGASISWTAISKATSYDGRYKKQSDSEWTTSTGVTSAWAISGLDANTAYEAQVRSQASGYEDGPWSSSVNFTTLATGLSAPTPSVHSVTDAAASVTWTSISNAESYDGRYKKQSESDWNTSTGVTSAWAISSLDANTAYEVQLRSQADGYADGAWSPSANFTTLKSGLTAPTPSTGSVTASGASVTWTAVSNAESYDGRYKKQSDSTWNGSTGVTSAWAVSGLDANTAYEVQLRAQASGYADGTWSPSVNFTTLKTGLSAPTPSIGGITPSGASISWTAVSNAESYDGRYKKQSDSNWSGSTGVTSAWALSSLDANTAYEVQLRAQASGYGDGAWSSSVNFTTLKTGLSAPNLSVGSITASGASVSWKAVSNAASYNGRYKKQSDTTWTPSNGVTSAWTLSGLDANTNYEAQIKAVAGSDYADSPWSASANFKTAKGTALAAPTPTAGNITQNGASVSWSAVTDASSYDLRYKKQADSTWTTFQNVSSPRTISGLDAATAYEAQLRSMNPNRQDGAWSSSASFTTSATAIAPGRPGSLNAAAGNASVFLYWSAPSSGDAPTRYEYQWRSTGSWSDWTSTGDASTKKTFSTLTNNTEYRYKLRACNSGGCSGSTPTAAPYYVAATPATNKTLPTAPGAPTGLTATAGTESVTLSWTAPASTGGIAVTGYEVGQDNGGSYVWTTTGSTGTSHTVTGLTGGTNYTFAVRAVNPVGAGTASSSASATALNPTLPAPVPAASSVTASGASVSWAAVANSSSYNLRYKKAADTDWTTATGATSPRSLSNLDALTAYQVQVKAIANSGYNDSPWSASTGFTTLSKGTLAAPSPSVAGVTVSTASVSWSAVANASSYNLRHKKTSDSGWTTATGVTSPRSLSGLDANTAYQVQMKTIASAHYTNSPWSASVSFTTSTSTIAAPTPSVSNVTTSGASVSWSAVANAYSYDIRHRKQSEADWTTATGAKSPYALSSLEASTSYQVQLRSVPSGQDPGAWSSSVSFTTLKAALFAPTPSVGSITPTTASVSWSAIPNAGAYDLRYKKESSADWTASMEASSPHSLAGLEPNTAYEAQLRTRATGHATGSWSASAYFATNRYPGLAAPGPAASNVTTNSASISWTPVLHAETYDLRFKKKTGVTWTVETGASSPQSISFLDANTEYEAQVRSMASSYLTGPWSASASFTTDKQQGLSAPTPILGTVGFNAASIEWSGVADASSYDLRFKRQEDENWSVSNGVTSPVNLQNLQNETNYEAQLRSKSADYHDSPWSASIAFTTNAVPYTPVPYTPAPPGDQHASMRPVQTPSGVRAQATVNYVCVHWDRNTTLLATGYSIGIRTTPDNDPSNPDSEPDHVFNVDSNLNTTEACVGSRQSALVQPGAVLYFSVAARNGGYIGPFSRHLRAVVSTAHSSYQKAKIDKIETLDGFLVRATMQQPREGNSKVAPSQVPILYRYQTGGNIRLSTARLSGCCEADVDTNGPKPIQFRFAYATSEAGGATRQSPWSEWRYAHPTDSPKEEEETEQPFEIIEQNLRLATTSDTIPAFGMWAIASAVFMGIMFFSNRVHPFLAPPYMRMLITFAFMMILNLFLGLHILLTILIAVVVAGIAYFIYGLRK